MIKIDKEPSPFIDMDKVSIWKFVQRLILTILFISGTCNAALYPPKLVPLGTSLMTSKKTLSANCYDIEVTTIAKNFSIAKESQIQLKCVGFNYLGKVRTLKLIFSDNKLDMVQILNIRNVIIDLKNTLITQYGEPVIRARWFDYFDDAGISLDVLNASLTFVSDRLKKQYRQYSEVTKDNHINLKLTKGQWLQDLKALDHNIRNNHINPFYHNSEKGYLQLFYQACDYIKQTKNPDSNIINGYIEKLVAYTGDGHSYVVGRTARYDEYRFFLDYFDEDMHIVSVDEKNKHLLGAKIIAFDNIGVDEAKELIQPFSPSVNSSSIKRESIYLYRHPGLLFAAGISQSANQVQLTLQLTNGERVNQIFYKNSDKEIKWARLQENEGVSIPLHRQKADKMQWIKYLPDSNSIYLHYGIVVEKEKGDIRQLSQELVKAIDDHQADKLIIDIRYNPGGDSHLNATLINVISKHKKINQHGRLFVLTGRNTFSAAINFAGNMEMKTKAIFIGEKVGDSSSFPGESGPQAGFKLPNSSIVVNLSFSEWNATFDYDQRDAVGLDIPVTISFNDFTNGLDPILSAALKYKSPEMKTIKLNRNQQHNWVGRYDFSPDKALKIFKRGKQLQMEITEWVFTDLYPISTTEMLTDISGVKLKKLSNGKLVLLQDGNEIRTFAKLKEQDLKPLELLISGQFSLAKVSYQELHQKKPLLLSIRGNSLGILASHLRARHNAPKLYEQLREIAITLYGEHIVSWDADAISI
jgi:hypothetical protein